MVDMRRPSEISLIERRSAGNVLMSGAKMLEGFFVRGTSTLAKLRGCGSTSLTGARKVTLEEITLLQLVACLQQLLLEMLEEVRHLFSPDVAVSEAQRVAQVWSWSAAGNPEPWIGGSACWRCFRI